MNSDPGGSSASRRVGSALGRCRALILLASLAIDLGVPSGVVGADDGSEVAQLRQELAEKDRLIERLNAELTSRGVAPPVAASIATTPVPPLASLLPEPAREVTRGQQSSLFDNLSFFAGIDGSKQPQDFGVNALFGGRFDVNWGVPILKDRGLGFQVGTSLNASLNAVQVFERIEGTKQRLQNFTTVGVFQRTDWGLNWAVGHDFLFERYYGDFRLGQWRGKLGYALDDRNEVGARLMLRSYGSSGRFGSTRVRLNPIDMGTLFWRHTWAAGPSTTFWAGLADGHNEPNAALGDAGPVRHPFVYGAEVEAPLNDHAILFGQANFITPPSTGTVDAFLGVVYYPADPARRERSRRSRPVLPVANNPTFAVDLGRRR